MNIRIAAAAAVALLTACSVLAAPQKKRARIPKTLGGGGTPVSVQVKQENQFVTVEEFVKAKRAAKTAVSVEGYEVLAFAARDGSVRTVLVDSVDHVLNARDANAQAVTGAIAVIPPAVLKAHPGWGWKANGMMRVAMFTGPGTARKQIHDTVAKVRITGLAVPGKAVINPTVKVEFQNESGDWQVMR